MFRFDRSFPTGRRTFSLLMYTRNIIKFRPTRLDDRLMLYCDSIRFLVSVHYIRETGFIGRPGIDASLSLSLTRVLTKPICGEPRGHT